MANHPCAENGADAYILYGRTLAKWKESGFDHTIEDLPGPRTFDMADCSPDGKRAKLMCIRALALDADL